ncbi:MAG: hypothetical protein QM635_05405 [Microbacteriaceae bacterium]
MTVLVVIVLVLNAAFNLFSWPRFLARVAADPRARDAEGRATRFLTVHRVLVGIAIALAVASVLVAVLTLVVR